MLNWEIRVVLIVGAFVTMGFMLHRIRSSRIRIEDSIFWILFSVMIVLLSLFPQIAFWVGELLNVQSPINVVYLVMIFVLLVKLFTMTAKMSQLESKVNRLAQRMALEQTERAGECKREDKP